MNEAALIALGGGIAILGGAVQVIVASWFEHRRHESRARSALAITIAHLARQMIVLKGAAPLWEQRKMLSVGDSEVASAEASIAQMIELSPHLEVALTGPELGRLLLRFVEIRMGVGTLQATKDLLPPDLDIDAEEEEAVTRIIDDGNQLIVKMDELVAKLGARLTAMSQSRSGRFRAWLLRSLPFVGER
jgi:hypothetical protein